MDNQKNFTCYYYNLFVLGKKDIDLYISKTEEKLNNTQGFEITKLLNGDYFIRLLKDYDMDIYPKRGKRNSDVRTLRNLDIGEDESLYIDTFIYLSFKNNNILNNSIGIISVLKSGKEIGNLILVEFFKELFGIKIQAFQVLPITYKSNEEYINKVSKLTKLSFQVSAANLQRPLGINETDGLNSIFKLKDELGGDTVGFSISGVGGLKKEGVLEFWKTYGSTFKGGTTITIEEAGKSVQQKIDEIRFKSTIGLKILDNALDTDEVQNSMLTNYSLIIENIKEEYLNPKE